LNPTWDTRAPVVHENTCFYSRIKHGTLQVVNVTPAMAVKFKSSQGMFKGRPLPPLGLESRL
jgi:hypothetical protein